MACKHPLLQADAELFGKIKKELGEDTDVLEKHIALFKKWLMEEEHLPNNVDESIIRNFVRHCKFDLDKAKRKFENFLQIRLKLKDVFAERNFDDAYFANGLHRQIVPFPQLGPDGYRYGTVRPPKSADQFDFNLTFHFATVFLDFLLLEDACAGYVGLFDLANFTPKHLMKLNVKLLLQAIDLVYNVSPFRIKAMHFLNVPKIALVLLNVAKKLLSKKMQSRVFAHSDLEGLAKHIPANLLPKDYGGGGESLDEIAEDLKEYFIKETGWQNRIKELKIDKVKKTNEKESNVSADNEIEDFAHLSID